MLSPATKDETLFIGGFPPQTKEKDLKEYFSSYSSLVSISIVKNCFEKSRGFGYVTFSNPEDVKAVINGIHKLNGKMVSPIFSIDFPLLPLMALEASLTQIC